MEVGGAFPREQIGPVHGGDNTVDYNPMALRELFAQLSAESGMM